jgi:hypothetical protein
MGLDVIVVNGPEDRVLVLFAFLEFLVPWPDDLLPVAFLQALIQRRSVLPPVIVLLKVS